MTKHNSTDGVTVPDAAAVLRELVAATDAYEARHRVTSRVEYEAIEDRYFKAWDAARARGMDVPDESQLLKAARRVVETRDMLFWSDARIDAMRGLEEAVAAHGAMADVPTPANCYAASKGEGRCANFCGAARCRDGVTAGATDHVARELAAVQPPWPKERRVGRRDDMSVDGKLHVMLQEDGDVCVQVVKGATSPNMSDFQQADIEFCVPGSGGGRSPRTREALVALMVAIEADNAAHPIPAAGVMASAAPLSEERLHELATAAGFGFFGQWQLYQGARAELVAFARAVEAAHGVSGRCHQTFCAQTPIPSPMDNEGEG